MTVKTQGIEFRDALLTTMSTQDALIKLLVRKGIITKEELLEGIKEIKSKKYVSLA